MSQSELSCEAAHPIVGAAFPAPVEGASGPPVKGPDRHAEHLAEQQFIEQMRIVLPKLRALARVLLSDSDEAEDLVQECLLGAWNDREGFSAAADPFTWFQGRLRRRLSAPDAHAGPVFERNGGWMVTLRAPEDQELAVDCHDTLKALGRLPPQSRQVLELIAAGVTYDEAARACRCCLGTFKSRLARARDLLAERVRGHGETVVW